MAVQADIQETALIGSFQSQTFLNQEIITKRIKSGKHEKERVHACQADNSEI
jgi:hypothetical protein